MKKTWVMAIAFLMAFASINVETFARRGQGITEGSYARARRILDDALQAVGSKNSDSIEDLTLKYTAKAVELGQSASPNKPQYVTDAEGTRVIDYRGKRTYQELKTHFLGGIPLWLQEVLTDKDGFTFDPASNTVFPVAAASLAGGTRTVQRLFPHLVLQIALSRASTLRWLAEDNFEGKKQQVITYSDDGPQVALYFDAQTKLLTKYETLGDGLLGPAVAETIFYDYRSVNGVMIPYRVVTKFGGDLSTDLTYTSIAANTHPAGTVFEKPKDAETGPESGAGPATVTKLANDVYFVNYPGGRPNFKFNAVFYYSQLAVVFNDYVLLIEAPLSDGTSQVVIRKMKETAPNKPIKYVVPTHYHFDHLGGVRGYIAEGATIVTTPGNKELIEKIASTPHNINPDSLSRNPRSLSLETFKDKRVFTDGEHTVELYNIGPTPHVDEMIIAYLPKEKIAFVTDVFEIYPFGAKHQIGPANPSNIDLARKMEQLGLQPEIIVSGHGRVGSMKDLREALEHKDAPKH
jgi:glyoxylase-like metal-dependent hydrolase (beta-lactamase superfamily II)